MAPLDYRRGDDDSPDKKSWSQICMSLGAVVGLLFMGIVSFFFVETDSPLKMLCIFVILWFGVGLGGGTVFGFIAGLFLDAVAPRSTGRKYAPRRKKKRQRRRDDDDEFSE